MKKAKERQITFYAEPDVFEWLKRQSSVTRYLNATVRTAMRPGADPSDSSDAVSEGRRLSGLASNSAIKTVVTELEQIQDAIFRSYKRQQAMIGALRTHQKLFEKSATFYREIGRIRDEEAAPEPDEFMVSSYNELLLNSADSIRAIIESTELDQASLIAQSGIKERLIAAIESDGTNKRDVDAPARTFSLNVPGGAAEVAVD